MRDQGTAAVRLCMLRSKQGQKGPSRLHACLHMQQLGQPHQVLSHRQQLGDGIQAGRAVHAQGGQNTQAGSKAGTRSR